jgi:hypothetical protein
MASNAIFKVPNNDEGRAFITLMKKFLNRRAYTWVRYSRGKRKHAPVCMLSKRVLDHEQLKIPFGESWAVYVNRR